MIFVSLFFAEIANAQGILPQSTSNYRNLTQEEIRDFLDHGTVPNNLSLYAAACPVNGKTAVIAALTEANCEHQWVPAWCNGSNLSWQEALYFIDNATLQPVTGTHTFYGCNGETRTRSAYGSIANFQEQGLYYKGFLICSAVCVNTEYGIPGGGGQVQQQPVTNQPTTAQQPPANNQQNNQQASAEPCCDTWEEGLRHAKEFNDLMLETQAAQNDEYMRVKEAEMELRIEEAKEKAFIDMANPKSNCGGCCGGGCHSHCCSTTSNNTTTTTTVPGTPTSQQPSPVVYNDGKGYRIYMGVIQGLNTLGQWVNVGLNAAQLKQLKRQFPVQYQQHTVWTQPGWQGGNPGQTPSYVPPGTGTPPPYNPPGTGKTDLIASSGNVNYPSTVTLNGRTMAYNPNLRSHQKAAMAAGYKIF